MAKTSNKSPEEKLRVVLSVLRGEVSAAAAGRRAGVSEQTVHNWKKLFLDAGREGLAQGRRRRSAREAELEAECEEQRGRRDAARASSSIFCWRSRCSRNCCSRLTFSAFSTTRRS